METIDPVAQMNHYFDGRSEHFDANFLNREGFVTVLNENGTFTVNIDMFRNSDEGPIQWNLPATLYNNIDDLETELAIRFSIRELINQELDANNRADGSIEDYEDQLKNTAVTLRKEADRIDEFLNGRLFTEDDNRPIPSPFDLKLEPYK